MSSAQPPLVRCAGCERMLVESPSLPPASRRPCPDCGSTARRFDLALGAIVGTSAVTASLSLESTAPVEALEDAGFDVSWLQLSEGGAWMVMVKDREGKLIDGSVQDDPQEALLAVSERLLPPSG